MKKLIFSVALIASLGLAACGDVEEITDEDVKSEEVAESTDSTADSEKETETKTETEDNNVTESEIGKMTTLYQNKELNIPLESGSAKATLQKIRYATLEPSETSKALFDNQDIVSLITIEASVENTVDSTVNFFIDQAKIVTDTGQQVDANMWLGDSIGGEFLGAVKKEGAIQWVLKHDENVKKITLHINGANDESFNRLSEDLKIEIPFE